MSSPRAIAQAKACRALMAALIDVTAMLEHYQSGRAHNWDGSTKGQTASTLRDAQAAIAQARAAGITTP